MNLNTVIFKRRRILGDLYDQCDAIESIPVYMNNTDEEPIGTVEESPATYGDAYVFKLPANICKAFAVGDYHIGVDYDFADKDKTAGSDRIKLNHMILVAKQKAIPYGKRGSHQVVE